MELLSKRNWLNAFPFIGFFFYFTFLYILTRCLCIRYKAGKKYDSAKKKTRVFQHFSKNKKKTIKIIAIQKRLNIGGKRFKILITLAVIQKKIVLNIIRALAHTAYAQRVVLFWDTSWDAAILSLFFFYFFWFICCCFL